MGKSGLENFIDSLRLNDYEDSQCFLCAKELGDRDSTLEHIIPKWAQNRYGLWDQKMVLLNDTTIPYRQLVVPCCKECNTKYLNPIEEKVDNATKEGFESFRDLSNRDIFIWMGKVYYGLLYRELSLLVDRSDPEKGTIITPGLINRFDMHRIFLQRVRGDIELVNFEPGSILVLRAQRLPDERLEWDFVDSFHTTFTGIRLGGIALLAVLNDGGAMSYRADEYEKINDLPLHPLQFRELCARIGYLATLATRNPKYLTLSSNPNKSEDPHEVMQLPLGGLSKKPLHEGWKHEEYIEYLSALTGIDEKELFEPPDLVWTCIYTQEGSPKYLDFEEQPYTPWVEPV